jgi:WD40 repeat protein
LIATPDARYAVADSGADDRGLDILDLTAGRLTRLIGHSAGTGALAFAANGGLVISGSMDNTVRVWNGRSGSELCRLTSDFHVRAVAASRDGRTVIAGDDSGAVHLLALRR